jgi:hypothetical protein
MQMQNAFGELVVNIESLVYTYPPKSFVIEGKALFLYRM